MTELFRRSSAILLWDVSDPAIKYIVEAFAADKAEEGRKVAKSYILLGEKDSEGKSEKKT